MAKKSLDENITPEMPVNEVPKEVSSAHSAVMSYTRSTLWLKAAKRTIVIALVAIAIIGLFSKVFMDDGGKVVNADKVVVDGIDGIDGIDGLDGKDGKDGAPGKDGADGQDGKDGAPGVAGKDGQDGEDGEKGKDGATGATGPQGPQGPQGEPGVVSEIEFINGDFTISIDNDLYEKGIAISETRGFTYPTARLSAAALENAWNITLEDIPKSVDSDIGGSKSSKDYFAYTFFLKNTSPGMVPLDYKMNLNLVNDYYGAVEAIRFLIVEDGESKIYACDRTDYPGTKEPFACDEAFSGDVNLLEKTIKNLQYNQVKRYTLILWYEGNDPECVDNILGGAVEFSLNFEVVK